MLQKSVFLSLLFSSVMYGMQKNVSSSDSSDSDLIKELPQLTISSASSSNNSSPKRKITITPPSSLRSSSSEKFTRSSLSSSAGKEASRSSLSSSTGGEKDNAIIKGVINKTALGGVIVSYNDGKNIDVPEVHEDGLSKKSNQRKKVSSEELLFKKNPDNSVRMSMTRKNRGKK